VVDEDVDVTYDEAATEVTEAAPLDVERLARAMHLARRLTGMQEPYCDNPLTDTDLRAHMEWAEAILHAYTMLPPYTRLPDG
jgi:hypothetical protein